MINKKILLMILFSFAAHMAVAAVIVYVPSEITKDMLAGHPDNVIWGYVSEVSPKIHNENQPDKAVLSLNPSAVLRVNSEKNVQPIDDRRGFLTPLQGFSSESSANVLLHASTAPALSVAEIDSAKEQNEEPGNSSTLSGNSSINIQHDDVSVTSIAAGNDNYDMKTLAEYVRNEIERQKYYPDIARTKGIEGTVYINFYIGQDGTPGSISIAKSSGEKILDDAGIMTIRKIGKISNLHRELRELDIVVPITYKLE